MKSPLVTIGIPTYGRAETLRETLESIRNQSYQNLEVLISDNATPGNEKKHLAEEFDDPRFHFHFQETNLGSIENFNWLKENIHGVYFMWLGDDDKLDTNFIQETVSFLESHPDYSLVSGQPWWIEPRLGLQRKISTMDIQQESPIARCFHYFREVTHNSIFYGLMRAEHCKGHNMEACLGGDWLWVARQAYLGKLKTLDSTNLFRVNNDGHNGKYVKSLGASDWQAAFSSVSIGQSAYKDVLNNLVYEDLPPQKRLLFALFAGGSVVTKRHAFKDSGYFVLRSILTDDQYHSLRKWKYKWSTKSE